MQYVTDHLWVNTRFRGSSDEAILSRKHWLAVGMHGLAITVAVLGALALALHWLDLEEPQAITVSFLTLAFAQLWHVFNMRDPGSRLFRNDIDGSKWVFTDVTEVSGLADGADRYSLAASWEDFDDDEPNKKIGFELNFQPPKENLQLKK